MGHRLHKLAKGGIIRPGLLYQVVRKQPMALHASRSLVPNAPRRWATAFRFLSIVNSLGHRFSFLETALTIIVTRTSFRDDWWRDLFLSHG